MGENVRRCCAMMRHSKARIAVAAAIIAAATGLIVWSVSRIRTSDVPTCLKNLP